MANIYDLLAPIARKSLTWMSRRNLPQTQGKISLPGLEDSVEIFRDQWGIPHIYAFNQHDLFLTQGFVHAQDRLWQMELNRRTATGRLSELFGELALDTDRTVRTFGFNRLGQVDLAMDDQVKDAFIAYTQGVNAFLDVCGSNLPVEFKLIRHIPEPWQITDSAAFMRVMIWQLSHAWYGEVIRALITRAVGPEHANDLEIEYPDTNPLTLPKGIEYYPLDIENLNERRGEPFLAQGMGSNAWVVSGDKSATGKPYLCNDMHLALSIPGLWYQVHLEAGDYKVTGVTLPGLPAVLVGHNAHLAWGMTLAFTDCEDLYIEQFDPKSPLRYRTESGWQDAEVIEEKIKIKSLEKPYIEKVIITRHGPIISDIIGYAHGRLAIQSMALRPSKAFLGWFDLNQASNWDQFVEAMRLIAAPQLNVAYADVYGNIGYWVTGKVPIRAEGDGRLPSPGWNGEYEWIGEVPFDEMPHALNPNQGYIVTCNHRITPDDYPYFLGNVWMNGFRARRITDILRNKEKLSESDFRSLHIDFTCIPGLELVARVQEIISPDPDVNLALEQLRSWNGILSPQSVPGAIYEVTRYRLVRNILEPGLGPDLSLKLMGKGFHPLLLPSHEFYGHDTVTMFRLMDDPDSWWVKQAGGCEKLITQSLKEAINWLRDELGPQLDGWQWGRIHRVGFSHALSLQQPLDKVFNRGPFPIGGDTDTPCQTAISPNDPYDNKSWAPSFRQIIDLGDLSKSIAIFPPGQSGQLASQHYDDLIQPWLQGEYFPLLWTKEQVEKGSTEYLELAPFN